MKSSNENPGAGLSHQFRVTLFKNVGTVRLVAGDGKELYELRVSSIGVVIANQLDKLEFGGESPLTIRARLVSNRYCPDPLGIVTAEQLGKLEFTQFPLIHPHWVFLHS